jgi:hypothetical protein
MVDWISTGQANPKVSYACLEVEYGPRIQTFSQILGNTLVRFTRVLPEDLN